MAAAYEEVRYTCDGTEMHGRIYGLGADEEARPGVLVYPTFFGISEHTYGRAAALAELGYVAMACDLHGEGWYSGGTTDALRVRAETLFANTARIRAIGQTALDTFTARPSVDTNRLAAIGYCFGGQIALELAFTGAPLAAAVAFHPSLEGVTSSNAANVRGRLLLCIGTEDPMATPEVRATFEKNLKDSGIRWQMNLYGPVLHGFTEERSASAESPVPTAYDEWADRDSWGAMTALLKDVFG
jgi:dienelactone hydrolase